MDLFHRVVLFLIGICWLFVVYVGYQMFRPIEPCVINSFLIFEDEVEQGGLLHYSIDYCKDIDSPGEVHRQFVDSLVYTIPMQITNVPQGCHTAANVIKVPKNLPPGEYKINTIVMYHINAFRTMSYEYESNTFRVTKGGS